MVNDDIVNGKRAGLSNRIIRHPLWIGLVLLVWLLMISKDVVQVMAVSDPTVDPPERLESCSIENNTPPPSSSPQRLVLSINAANGYINWDRINNIHHSSSNDWNVEELVLDGFGTIMKDESFTSALDRFFPILQTTIQRLNPDILLVSSKGIGILAYLAAKDLWVNRPAILLSPIPNPIDGLVNGSSYQSEWNDIVSILRNKLGDTHPIVIAVGSSSDEEMLITESIETTTCGGKIQTTTTTTTKSISTFQNCTNWYHVVIPNGGDHGWKNLPENEKIIAKLINFAIKKAKPN